MNAVNFGEVRYAVRKIRIITIANTGQIAASFSFVERPAGSGEESLVAPRWLEVKADPDIMRQPEKGRSNVTSPMTLSPGETTSIELAVEITEGKLVQELNNGETKLEDILVLRIEHGRDHFIPIKGTWLQSAFFRSLEELVQAPDGGVRMLQSTESAECRGKGSMNHHSAPKELYALTEILPVYLERSTAEWGMIHDGETPPWQYETEGISWPFSRDTWTFHEGEERSDLLAGIREAMDTARPLDANFDPDVPCIVKLEVLAETFVKFLQSLRDGIIPAETWSEVEYRMITMEKGKVEPSREGIQDMVMDPLSQHPIRSVSFTFITFLLTRMINELVPHGAPASGSSLEAASPNTSRRSRASTMSSETGTEPSVYAEEAPPKRSLFSALRRRPTQSNTSSSGSTAEFDTAESERRKGLVNAYTDIFAPIVIRAENDDKVKGKDKKALEARKKKVLEAFLDNRQP